MRFSILFISLVVALLFAEIICRVSGEFSPTIRYLATAGFSGVHPIASSLEEHLQGFAPIIAPGREFYGFHANQLGFYDREFVGAKTEARFRVAVIGDSFTYGSVPYPDSVVALLEKNLKARCAPKDLEVYNFGIPGATVWDYKTLLPFVLERFNPDLVAINFYMGNDGPDLVHDNLDGPSKKRFALHSFLYALIRNLLRLRHIDHSFAPKQNYLPNVIKLQTSDQHLSDEVPPFNQPAMDIVAWRSAMRDELFHLFSDPAARKQNSWRELEAQLSEINFLTKNHGAKLLISMLPSHLQVDGNLRAEVIKELQESLNRKGISKEQFSAERPEVLLMDYCNENQLQCMSLRSVFAAQDNPAKFYRIHDTHWNFAGNALAAQAQTDFFAQAICAN